MIPFSRCGKYNQNGASVDINIHGFALPLMKPSRPDPHLRSVQCWQRINRNLIAAYNPPARRPPLVADALAKNPLQLARNQVKGKNRLSPNSGNMNRNRPIDNKMIRLPKDGKDYLLRAQ